MNEELNKNWIVDRVNESFNFYYWILKPFERDVYEKFCYAYLDMKEVVSIDSTDIDMISRVFHISLLDNDYKIIKNIK